MRLWEPVARCALGEHSGYRQVWMHVWIVRGSECVNQRRFRAMGIAEACLVMDATDRMDWGRHRECDVPLCT